MPKSNRSNKQQTQASMAYISNFMQGFATIRAKIEHDLGSDNYFEKLIEREHANKLEQIKSYLNIERGNLLRRIKQELETSINEPASSQRLYFRQSSVDISCVELMGHLKLDEASLVRRIKNLRLQRKFTSVDCGIANAEHLISLSQDRILRVQISDTIATLSLVNPQRNSTFAKTEIKLTIKKRFQYCRASNKIVMLFFELDYDKKYELEVYDLKTLRFISSRVFDCYISQVCASHNEIVSWSSEREPYICFFDFSLKKSATHSRFDERIFDKYYALADFSDGLLVLHSQNFIGVVSRDTGKILYEINMEEYSAEAKAEENLSPQELDHMNRNRAYLSHAKFEYINIKFYMSTRVLILTTWSKILVFELDNNANEKTLSKKFSLLVENDLRLIANNNWNLPNRVYVNSRDGCISFFDAFTKWLTFV